MGFHFRCDIFQRFNSYISGWIFELVRTMTHSQPQERQLIESSFLFHFSVPCYYCKDRWKKGGISLPEKYTVACFDQLDESPKKVKKPWAEVRLAWNTEGLLLNLSVTGKKQDPWCRSSRIEDSDGMAVWINTRSGSPIHRASRFCHEYHFLPFGEGSQMQQPIARQSEIKRAKENAKISSGFPPDIRSQSHSEGYALQAFVPGKGISGFDPEEHPEIGFHFIVSDRELGTHAMTLGDAFPTDADPSLWSTLEFVRG